MKIKKSALVAIALASFALVGFVGCPKDATTPEQKYVYTDVMPTLSIKNGSTEIDPLEVSVIDIDFPVAMDTNYGTYIYWGNIDADVYASEWVNSYKYRFYVDLRYDTDYKIVFNDSESIDEAEGYTEDSFIRTYDGKLIKRFPIEFKTKASPLTHPHTFEFSLKDVSPKLADNSQYNPGTQQTTLNIRSYLKHDMVKAGDTVKISYKIKSQYDLKNIKTNLVDTHKSVNYWLLLNSKDTEDLLLAEDVKAGEEKEGVLEFKIVNDQVANFELQIYTTFEDNPDLVNIDFIE
ncbi:MAG: hypothetical protein K6A43_10610 [Treponema sp.]|nr:hypothetical protein [Treponema sp.]